MKKKRTARALPHAQAKPAPGSRLSIRMVETPAPYAEVSIHEPVTEDSIERLFELTRTELLRHSARRVLVDMSDAPMALSISDLNGLTKLVSGNFAGVVERLAVVVRPADVPTEKFFEPAMINRGMPTYVTLDVSDAIDWLTAKFLPVR
jgi:hypothetical protein